MTTPLLEIKNLSVDYTTTGNLGSVGHFRALKNVSLAVDEGKTLGIVGESGCGKSTLAKAITRLLAPAEGQILYNGKDIAGFKGDELKAYRRGVQMIFQDPSDSLNPKHNIQTILREPLEIHRIANKNERVKELLDLVGLPVDYLKRYPHQLSGGQRQRVGIARALALNPRLIICDEPVSALDLSIQSQIINLLLQLQQRLGLSYLFISHDLRLVRHFSDNIAVLYNGQCVEYGPATDIYFHPTHAYTRQLLSSL